MNCNNFYWLLDDHLDKELDAEVEAQANTHVAACAACAARRDFALELRQSLQELPVVEPSAGYANRVLAAARSTRPHSVATARGEPQRRFPLWASAGALAASFALAVGLWTTYETLPEVAAGAAQPVRLVFRSESAMSGVTIELGLPEGVELEGYPGQRRLVWQSNLRAGANLLELPVLLHGGSGGVLTATLNYGTERREFSVRVVSTLQSGVTPADSVHQKGAGLLVLSTSSIGEENSHA